MMLHRMTSSLIEESLSFSSEDASGSGHKKAEEEVGAVDDGIAIDRLCEELNDVVDEGYMIIDSLY